MIKTPDIAGFAAGVFALLATLPPIYWSYFSHQAFLEPPARVFLSFYLTGEQTHDGFLSVIASMAYYQTGHADRTASIVHERADVRFQMGDRREDYVFRWQHRVDGGESMINYQDPPAILDLDDAEPFLLKSQSVVQHFTLFAPRTEICATASCDPKRNYLERGSETGFLSEVTSIRFTFTATLLDGRTLTAGCIAQLDAAHRRRLAGLAHSRIRDAGDAPPRFRDVLELGAPCAPLPSERDLRRSARGQFRRHGTV